MLDDVCVLRSKSYSGATESTTDTQVFCKKKSVNRTEFYSAAQVGLSPKMVLVVSADDFNVASEDNEVVEVFYRSKPYVIIRTYEKDNYTELTCGVM